MNYTADPSITTGIYDHEQSKIHLYPNPVSKILYVEGVEDGDRVMVLDEVGKQMLIVTATAKTFELYVTDYPQGFYYVVIDNKNIVLKFLR